MKKCYRCKEVKDFKCFSKHKRGLFGLRSTCKDCNKIEKQIYRSKPESKEITRLYLDRNRERNNKTRNKRRNKLKKENVKYKLTEILRSRLYHAIKKHQKRGSAVRDLGCSVSCLKFWLELHFYDNPETGEKMSWENWKHDGWHIDHIIPLFSFDLEDRKQFLQANHFTNLQPLWSKENFKKRHFIF